MKRWNMSEETILQVKDLAISFETFEGKVKAVRGVNFELKRGETLAIVGESGSGKSVSTKAINGLLPKKNTIIESGEILFEGRVLLKISEAEMQEIRGKDIAMIFQDPMISLNPTFAVVKQIAYTMIKHLGYSVKEAIERATECMRIVVINT